MTADIQRRDDVDAATAAAKNLSGLVAQAAQHMAKTGGARFGVDRVERLQTLTRLACEKNPKILKCTPQSVWWAYLDAARCGLEWDGVEGALVPFYNTNAGCHEARFMPMVRGLVRLLVDNGAVTHVDAVPVYEGEPFAVYRGLAPDIKHTVRMDVDRSDDKLIAAYAVFWLPNGQPRFSVMSVDEIKKRRASSKTWSRYQSGPWKDWFAEMAIKTVVRHGFKMIPTLPPQVNNAYRIDSRPMDATQLSATAQAEARPPALPEAPSTPSTPLDALEAAANAVDDETPAPTADKPPAKQKAFTVPKKDAVAVASYCKSVDEAATIVDLDAILAKRPEFKGKSLDAVTAWEFYKGRCLEDPEADNLEGLPPETSAAIGAVQALIA